MARWLTARHGGVLIVLDVAGPHLPRLVYWGADWTHGREVRDDELAALPGAGYRPPGPDTVNADIPVTLSPSRAQGWSGRPGLTGHRSGLATQPLFSLADVSTEADPAGSRVTYCGSDAAAALRLDGELELTVDGVLRHRQTLTSTAPADATDYVLDELVTLLPVSEHVVEVLDHAGRWSNEAQQQRVRLEQGGWLREMRRGRTGPDTPLLFSVGTAGVGYRTGEVWGLHLAWSGDQRYLAQRLNTGAVVLAAGEILAAGEVILGPGESVTTPWVYGAYSASGLDGASRRLHTMLRRRPAHPHTPRPVVLNTWEAVYFEHSFERLAALADVAADIGVERFVVDDGWFGSRRDDRSGLGDWYVSPEVWPNGPRGLRALADRVRARGMQFGLWLEPEMVSLDSELARRHPDWVLGTPGRMPPPARGQQVLDVAHPAAFGYLLDRISTLVGEHGIGFIKWDHNRDIADPVHRSGPHAGRPALRDQTLAAYRLMAELRKRHPALEIESCSSGGARIDYGVLEHTDRVWASDCLDPVERVRIVAGISTLLPFELIGAHVGAPRSHTTGRHHDLALRCAVALFGHTGFEWDLTATSADERDELRRWVAFAKSVRPLLHTGELVRLDRPAHPGTAVYGVVAADRGEALFAVVRLQAAPRSGTAPVRLAGLDPERRYRVRRVRLPGEASTGWGEAVVRGAQLMRAGLPAPDLRPEQAALFQVRAGAGAQFSAGSGG